MSTAIISIKALPSNLQKAVAQISEIGSLPEITARIVEMVEDPLVTAHDMHSVIRMDPALAARILKVVNSPFYGLPSQITSLERAVLLLGLSAVKNIALAASLSRLFSADAVSHQFAARDLWRHCIAVGVCARMLAIATACPQPDELFVAGLMHDMGLLVERRLFPDKLSRVVEQCYNRRLDFCQAEETVIGADHQAFGGALAEVWKFPPGLRWAMSAHHRCEPVSQPELQKVADIVYVADTLCSAQRIGFWLGAQMQVIGPERLARLGLDQGRLERMTAELGERVEEAERIFE
jgi:HD-like signal output (HDOD) protein